MTAVAHPTQPPDSLLIGYTVEKQLDAALWRLVQGDIGLHECTPALRGWYSVGHHDGIESCKRTILRLEADVERYYLYAFNPRDRAELIRQRIDDAYLQEEERQRFADGQRP